MRRSAARDAERSRRSGYPILVISYRNDPGAPGSRGPPAPSRCGRVGGSAGGGALRAQASARRVVLYGFSMGGPIVANMLDRSMHDHDVAGVVLGSAGSRTGMPRSSSPPTGGACRRAHRGRRMAGRGSHRIPLGRSRGKSSRERAHDAGPALPRHRRRHRADRPQRIAGRRRGEQATFDSHQRAPGSAVVELDPADC